MLIAEDLVYENIIQMPSIDTFSKIIYHLDKGAFKGLQKLNVISRTDNERKKLVGFKEVYEKVQELLTATNSHLISDIFHYEHTLCKVSKALNSRYNSPFRV